MSNPIYLKQYEGVTSGSYMGRDNGYPETKYRTYENIEELSRDFGKQKEEQYFKLVPISKEELEKEVKNSLKEQSNKERIKKKTKIEEKIKKLQEELEQLDK